MNGYGDHNSLTIGLRALTLLADNCPVDVAGFAKLSSVSEDQARDIILSYEKFGYARRLSHPDLYILTPLARDLIGRAGPGDRLN